MKVRMRKLTLCMALLLLCTLLCSWAGAEGAEPSGDGNGILSRPLLATLYKWLNDMDGEFMKTVTFEQVSNAVGKWGCVKEKSKDDYHAAYWTDGQSTVTVTFRDYDGFWGVSAITTDLSREEYESADDFFMPHVGNREAGSSETYSTNLTTSVKGGSGDVMVTCDVPVENWYPTISFGEIRFQNAPSESSVTGNSSGMRISFWPDEASILAEQAKGEDQAEAEDLYLFQQIMHGCEYTRNGMRLTDYTVQIHDGLWMRITLNKIKVYIGSEAEAILKSMKVQQGENVYSWEPLGMDWDDEEDDEEDDLDLIDDDFSEEYIQDSPYMANGQVFFEDKNDNRYLYNNFTAEELSFSHDMESDNYYSYADFDIVILDPDTEHPLPILRLWITMVTKEKPVNIHSVTFTTGGRDYTFSELSDPEDIIEGEGEYEQTMLIRFDADSQWFLTQAVMNHLLGDETMKAVFHGDVDMEVEFGEHFWNVLSIYFDLYTNSDAATNLNGYTGNPMESELAP